MNDSFRKLQMLLAITGIAVAGNVQGSIDTSGFGGSCEESCPVSCCSDSCGRFFLDAGLLYLRAYEGGLANVCDSTHTWDSDESTLVISRLKGRSHDPDFDWNLGFRVGAGYEMPDCNCGVGAFWTHYHSHNHGHSHDNGSSWKLDFDVVDLLYSCPFDCSSCFTFTPYGGIRFANIDQKLHSRFLSTHNGDSIHSRGDLKEEFVGIGPMFGIDGSWGIGCGLSLYGNISAAALYGRFHVKADRTVDFHTGTNYSRLRKHICASQLALDTGFGVRWRTCFCCDKVLVLQLGLEQHRYFNLNQFCGYGDLSLDGVSLSAHFLY